MIFHARYIVYLSFTNSSSKNSSEVEFYRKKFINKHFSSRKSRKESEKKYLCLRLEICEENTRKKIE